ncbi:MAG: aldo/keto reductase [Methanomassiliicoccales archaeon]
MQYRYLGKTGIKVSELCLGTMTFGWKADEHESHRILDEFRSDGGNFIDTADVYGRGQSEKIIGSWLKHNDREEFIIATKVRFESGKGPNGLGLTRKHILHSLKESLSRLSTDYIDLYQMHAWDPATPIEETLSVFSWLVDEGYVRYIGASNFRGWQLQRAVDAAREMGFHQLASLQPQYSLICRATEFELLPLCIREGLGVLPWSPLGGGWLTGKYTKDMKEPPAGTRIGDRFREGETERWYSLANDRTWALIDELTATASKKGKTISQIALNWVLHRKGVTAPIVGASNLDQLKENLGACGWKLDRAEIEEIDRLSSINVGYPYDDRAEKQQLTGREDTLEQRV